MNPHPNRRAVVVTGSRRLPQGFHVVIENDLRVACSTEAFERTDLIVGDCPTGADLRARLWWGGRTDKPGEIWVFHANWDKHGRAAGPIRNREMLEFAKVGYAKIVVFAYPAPGSTGTKDCIAQASKLGLRVIVREATVKP